MPTSFPRRPPDHAADNADSTPREQPRSAVERAQERVAAARLKLAVQERRLRQVSVREQCIREGAVGRAVLDLLDDGVLEKASVDLIRAKVREHFGPAQAAAFSGTLFE
ncbi:hypothetical protein [Bradyrhizobium arachidis]|uniref:Uncharacterized protein n=1 Tax=Bradyrhizobium arachidis TaxID=858423 RepID=A0AAE7NLE1_9BRAD|nr:hypothetical protein [Bradyrhizobium arachidis]QOZ67416.1 hypothetical protein WN72_14705 [Bradyrhizobium arachidis]SFU81429.1 hypothetical protein SAMN05192541_105154 [Bradyrhizobium arachidis]